MNHDNVHNGHRDAILDPGFKDASVDLVTYQDPWVNVTLDFGSTARLEVPLTLARRKASLQFCTTRGGDWP
jgi:hypothetical protein